MYHKPTTFSPPPSTLRPTASLRHRDDRDEPFRLRSRTTILIFPPSCRTAAGSLGTCLCAARALACCTFKPLEPFSLAWHSPLAGILRFSELALALFREAGLQAPLTRLVCTMCCTRCCTARVRAWRVSKIGAGLCTSAAAVRSPS